MSVSDTLANDNHVVLDCCGGLSNLDYSKVDMSLLGEVVRHVDVSDPRFCVAVLAVLFNPFFWNVVARWEHRTRGLSRLFRSPSLACYCLGVLIILLNVYRSHSMAVVMKAQPRWELLDRVEVFYAGAVLMAAGGLLVLTSFLSLGFTGTFLGTMEATTLVLLVLLDCLLVSSSRPFRSSSGGPPLVCNFIKSDAEEL
ncbi:unnamed protein product [Gadus morhua 'NCC']